MKTMDYKEIRPTLRTGDSVSFSGKSIESLIIKGITLSKWTHDGIIVVAHDIDKVLCWESTTLASVPDFESGTIKSGVMLVDFSKRIATYKGEIGIRRLRNPLTPHEIQILLDMQREVKDTPYEKDMIELFKAAYDGPFGLNVEDLNTIFCTELKAEFYKRIYRLPATVPANEYTPKDAAGKVMSHFLEEMIMIAA